MAINHDIDADGVLEVVMDNPPVNALGINDTQEIAKIFESVR